MLEVGRPTHVFDLGRIHGGLTVRWANDGETLKLLNGETVMLASDVGVIADAHRDRKPGRHHGRQRDRRFTGHDGHLRRGRVLVARPPCAGRARRYGLSSEAAHRFERGVDATTTVEHIDRITRLVLDICGTRLDPHRSDRRPAGQHARSTCRCGCASRARRRSSVCRSRPTRWRRSSTVSASTTCATAKARDEVFAVTPPPYRFDLEIEEDLIEEVARGHGFEKIPAHLPVARHGIRAQPEERRSGPRARRRARRARLSRGDQLQLRRGGLGARLRRQRTIRSAC